MKNKEHIMNKKNILYISSFVFIILNIIIDLYIKKYFKILNICFSKNIIVTNKLYAFICFIIAIIFILIDIDMIFIIFNKKSEIEGIKFKLKDGTYGTANWMNETEMNEILGLNNTSGIILGKFDENIIKLPFESYFNKNICVFGSSGSMKTIRFCINKFIRIIKI